MRKLILSLFAIVLITGCSTVPSEPKPHESKFAVQVIEITLSEPAPQIFPLEEVLALIDENKDDILEYPIVYAAVGETAKVDETETVSIPEQFEIVEGKAVGIEQTHKLGLSVEATFLERMILQSQDESIGDVLVEYTGNDSVLLKLHTFRKELVGYDTQKLTDEIEVKIPHFSKLEANTRLINKTGLWAVIGGNTDSKTGLSKFICVRVIPPTGDYQ